MIHTGKNHLLRTATFYYFRNYYRSRSFYLMLFITLLVSGLMTYFTIKYVYRLSSLIPGADLSQIGSYSKEQIFGYFWSFVLLDLPVFAAVFFGSPAISSEIEGKTAFHIFPLPIGRSKLLISKYLAAVSATLVTVLIFIAFQAVVFIYLFHTIIFPFFESLLLLILFVFTITAFTFMISGIFNKNTYAYITVFLVYFLVFTAYQIIVEFLYRIIPYYLLNVAAGIIERVYINISPNPFNNSFTFSSAGNSDIFQSVAVMVAYFVISLSAALIIFERKEVK